MPRIFNSPSTQELNIGAGTYGTEEKQLNLLVDALEIAYKDYPEIIYARNKPNLGLGQVCADSNAFKADMHCAWHTNAMGGASSGKARGCEVFIHKFGSQSELFAQSLYSNLSALTPSADRGVKQGMNYKGPGVNMYELDPIRLRAPVATLAEIIFHDNLEDANWFMLNRVVIANSILKTQLDYFKIPLKVDKIAALVAEMKQFGLITDTAYWYLVLSGKMAPDLEYMKISYQRAVNKLK
jgi:N-acetylmuramoyl-L-alanine amidase